MDTKKDAAVWARVASLVPWSRNPRKNAHAVESVARSIRELGWGAPLVARASDRRIVCGHTRWLAAKKLGLEEIPVRFVDLTDRQAEQLALADNRLGELADWDNDALAEILRAFSVEEAGLAGWTPEELEELGVLAPQEDPPGPSEPSRAAELRERYQVEPGQVWQLGEHLLCCGDSTSEEVVTPLFGGEQARLLVTDPPYGVDVSGGGRERRAGRKITGDGQEEFAAIAEGALRIAGRILAPGGAFFVWFCRRIQRFSTCVEANLGEIREEIVWVKRSFVLSRQDYHWQHEPCLFGWKSGAAHAWYGGRDQSTVWSWEQVGEVGEDLEKGIHPTAKPPGLYRIPMENHTKAGDLIYEPFSGSGTAIAVAERLGRRCIAVEIDPEFVAVAIQRWVDTCGGEPRRVE